MASNQSDEDLALLAAKEADKIRKRQARAEEKRFGAMLETLMFELLEHHRKKMWVDPPGTVLTLFVPLTDGYKQEFAGWRFGRCYAFTVDGDIWRVGHKGAVRGPLLIDHGELGEPRGKNKRVYEALKKYRDSIQNKEPGSSST